MNKRRHVCVQKVQNLWSKRGFDTALCSYLPPLFMCLEPSPTNKVFLYLFEISPQYSLRYFATDVISYFQPSRLPETPCFNSLRKAKIPFVTC